MSPPPERSVARSTAHGRALSKKALGHARDDLMQFFFGGAPPGCTAATLRSGVGTLPFLWIMNSATCVRTGPVPATEDNLSRSRWLAFPGRFQRTGTALGSPLYDWSAMKARGIRLVGRPAALGHANLRLHPPRSLPRLEQFWEIPASEPPREWPLGGWSKDELFDKLREALGRLPFFAEDLGTSRPPCTPYATSPDPGCGAAIRLWRCGRMCTCRTVYARSRCLHRHSRQRYNAGLVELG